MKLILANQKGGVGKTTCAYHFAHLFSREIMTLVIDLDPQGNLTDTLLGNDENGDPVLLKEENNISRVFERKDVETVEVKENLYLIGSNESLTSYASSMTLENISLVKKVVSNIEEKIGEKNIMVIIDTPPSLGLLTVNALFSGGKVVVPVIAHKYSLTGLKELINNIDRVKGLNVDIDILGFVFSMFNQQHKLDQNTYEKLEKEYPGLQFSTQIPVTTRVRQATEKSLPVFDFDIRNKATQAYLDVFKEIKERLIMEA